jgi:hypothetical protein
MKLHLTAGREMFAQIYNYIFIFRFIALLAVQLADVRISSLSTSFAPFYF